MAPNSDGGPFAGLRVLDFGTFVAGSFGAALLGDLGAEVIKVEALEGDPARFVPPFYGTPGQENPHGEAESRFYIGLNRNKRGMAIDVRSAAGREIVRRLVERADVVTENFRPGAARDLGLDYDTLRAINPRIILCAASGFGTMGPLARQPAFDGALQALAGIAKANERISGVAAHSAVLMVDYTTAILSLGAVATALYHRERTGVGQKVEISLLQSAMTLMTTANCRALEMEPQGTVGSYPYRLFHTADGAVFVGVAQNKFWPPLCRALGVPELGADPRYRHHGERGAHAAELNAIIEPIFKSLTLADAVERLNREGVPCGPVSTAEALFDHPQVAAMEMRQPVTHGTIGPMEVCGTPFRFLETPGQVRRAAPALGEHNREILVELGYSETEISELETGGTVRRPIARAIRNAGGVGSAAGGGPTR
jgi:crotonobetainyl-CoA:carnitine CoA-transferase CaiB-like acyl-CoA transferase